MGTKRDSGMVLLCAVCVYMLAVAGIAQGASARIFPEDLTMHITATRSGMQGGS